MVQNGRQPLLVPWAKSVEYALDAGHRARDDGGDFVGRHELLGEEWNDRQCKAERDEHGDGERGGERGEELSHNALQEAER
jgi:hypothetical protein